MIEISSDNDVIETEGKDFRIVQQCAGNRWAICLINGCAKRIAIGKYRLRLINRLGLDKPQEAPQDPAPLEAEIDQVLIEEHEAQPTEAEINQILAEPEFDENTWLNLTIIDVCPERYFGFAQIENTGTDRRYRVFFHRNHFWGGSVDFSILLGKKLRARVRPSNKPGCPWESIQCNFDKFQEEG